MAKILQKIYKIYDYGQKIYKKFIKFTIMDKKLMLEQLISHFIDGNKAQFAAKIGISPQNLSQWLNRGTFDAEIIFANCEGVSPRWLLCGQGEMLETNKQNLYKQNGNAEVLALCCELIANYQQIETACKSATCKRRRVLRQINGKLNHSNFWTSGPPRKLFFYKML